MSDIVGFDGYTSGRSKHLAGVVATGRTLEITLRAPSPTLPARLTTQYFCAIPPNTPVDPDGIDAIPSAGPYYVASSTPQDGLVLLRNPNYGGERPVNFDEIDVLPPTSQEKTIANVDDGSVDAADLVPSQPGAERIEAEYGPSGSLQGAGPPRYLPAPTTAVEYLALNSKRPLFSDARMRRAVNYAVDRAALAREPYPTVAGRPTDQYIPPGMLGFEDAAIYPLGGPDLTRARHLAGSRGGTAVMYTCSAASCKRNAEVVRSNLKPLGIDVRIHQFSNQELYARLTRPATTGTPGGWDLAQTSWFADYADPYDSVNVLFEYVPGLANGNFNLGQFDEPSFQRRLRRAARLTGPTRYSTYAALDADLSREAAPALAYASQTTNYFFSQRLGCEIVNASYGLDLPALCLGP